MKERRSLNQNELRGELTWTKLDRHCNGNRSRSCSSRSRIPRMMSMSCWLFVCKSLLSDMLMLEAQQLLYSMAVKLRREMPSGTDSESRLVLFFACLHNIRENLDTLFECLCSEINNLRGKSRNVGISMFLYSVTQVSWTLLLIDCFLKKLLDCSLSRFSCIVIFSSFVFFLWFCCVFSLFFI